ncbi:MAG: hypothetical protein ACREYE_27090, partial [Gammaproteobacteria bacterium]
DIIKKIERARVKMEQIKPRSTLPRGKKEGGLTVRLFKGHYTSSRVARDGFFTSSEAFSEKEISGAFKECFDLPHQRKKGRALLYELL